MKAPKTEEAMVRLYEERLGMIMVWIAENEQIVLMSCKVEAKLLKTYFICVLA